MSAPPAEPGPPRWALRLLLSALPPGLPGEAVAGDLEEELRERARRTSPARARRWYVRQAVGVWFRYRVEALAARPTPHPHEEPAMLRSLVLAARHALRSLWHAPRFALLASATLAVGMGATTTIFSVVDGVLLRPLPFPEADRLVSLGAREGSLTYSEPEYWDIAREAASLEAVAAWRDATPTLGSLGEPERIPIVLATSPLLPLLGVEPALGRVYTAEEDVAGAPERVVVLSHALWLRAFGGDPGAVGRTVLLEDLPYTVVGVMPPGFAFPGPEIQAWAPLRLDPADPVARNNNYLRLVGRLAEGASPGIAAAELDALAVRLAGAFPDFYEGPDVFHPTPLRERLVGDVRAPLLLLLGAVVGVLLVASVNAASLFLARGEGRRSEIALRTALGAGRGRIALQLLLESLLISLAAGALGVALAFACVAGLRSFGPADLPRLEQVVVDGRVLLVGLATSLLTGLFFGTAPALDGWRSDVREVLAGAGWGSTGGRRRARFRRALVVAQLSLATVLVLGSGLLLRSFAALREVELGFRPQGALAMPLAPSVSAVPPDAAAVAFYQELERRLAALPGVTAVGSALRLPLVDGLDKYSLQIEGRPLATIGDAPAPGIQWATPGWFDALGIRLLRGRLFTEADHADAPPVAVVSESVARELWPGEEAVGKRLRMFVEGSPWMEVMGVVADVKHGSLRGEAPGKLYVPHLQAYRSAYYSPNRMTVVLRTTGDASLLAGPARGVVRELAPGVPLGAVRTLDEVVNGALGGERFTLLLLGVFSGAALLLAAVGVYGVIGQTVAARTREIGVRMAVGAARGRIARQVLAEATLLAAWGSVLGLAGGALAARAARSLLFGVGPGDLVAYATVVPVLAVVVVLAALLPALRAARLDPVGALREG